MEAVKLPIHKHHLLLPFTRFALDEDCQGCGIFGHIYGGYHCNELGCEAVFHRECDDQPLQEIKHFLHPDHSLKLLSGEPFKRFSLCSHCGGWFEMFESGYICSICDFKMHVRCAKKRSFILENSSLHQHPLFLIYPTHKDDCKSCDTQVLENVLCYNCHQCDLFFHVECAFQEAVHTIHPKHPLNLLTVGAAPDYADNKCILCEEAFDHKLYHYKEEPFDHQLYHCDVCNFSICPRCILNPPPVRVESPTTHEHELRIVPRRIDFTCNACGTLGDRSPYFCLQCNFMIHRQCIDLPRVININRHDHRISYTRRLGHGEWKCKICRKKVDGFYGAYICAKCPSFVVHSRCATNKNVWDMRELEGMPEEEEDIPPFEVIDATTIKHFSHDHNLLRINKDGRDPIQPENIVCEACRLQILLEPFYSCDQCNFILHKKCANHPREKRHVFSNMPFTLLTDSQEIEQCNLCEKHFTGFRYKTNYENCYNNIDVRCAAISDTLDHESHPHPLFFHSQVYKACSGCGEYRCYSYSCDECAYTLDGKCAQLPKRVMKNRYDEHFLFLSFGDIDVDGEYWCEACEAKVNPKEWFYTCNECGTILHKSCVVGDFSYCMQGSQLDLDQEVVANTSICRPLCSGCNSRCKVRSILKISMDGVDEYYCSFECSSSHYE